MSLEDIGAVERLLGCRPGAWAEATHHSTLVMSQGVSVLVIFAGETLRVVLAGEDRALFRSLGLVGKHMRFQVLEDLATVGMWAATFLRR